MSQFFKNTSMTIYIFNTRRFISPPHPPPNEKSPSTNPDRVNRQEYFRQNHTTSSELSTNFSQRRAKRDLTGKRPVTKRPPPLPRINRKKYSKKECHFLSLDCDFVAAGRGGVGRKRGTVVFRCVLCRKRRPPTPTFSKASPALP